MAAHSAAPGWELADIHWDADQLQAFDAHLPVGCATSANTHLAKAALSPSKPPHGALAPALKPTPVTRVRGPRSRRCERTCLVSGCDGLQNATRYFLRLRLCKEHAHADVLVVEGEERRFCQKCNKLHALASFEGRKRTCTPQLQRHNEARREALKRRTVERSSSDETPMPTSTGTKETMPTVGLADGNAGVAELDDLVFDDSERLFLELLVGGSLAPGELDALPRLVRELPASPGPPAAAALQRLRLETGLELEAATLWVKLPRVTPAEVPWGGVRAAASAALSAGCQLATDEGHLALTGYIAPGCTLVGLDLLLAPGARPWQGLPDERSALRALLAAEGPTSRFLRSEAAASALLVRIGASIAGGRARGVSAELAALRLPPLHLLAALPSAPTRLAWRTPLPPLELRCRFHGQWLRVAQGALASPGEEGVALLEATPESGEAPAPPRPLLLIQDAAIVKELAAWASTQGKGDAAGQQHAESALIAAGHALRPGCDPSLIAFAAVAALRLGWMRLGTRLVTALAAAGGAPVPGRESTVLHAVAASGHCAGVSVVLAEGAGLLGGAGQPCLVAHSATPLHAACALADPLAAADLVRLLTEHDPAAVLAWSSAAMTGGGLAGATPSSLARAHSSLPELRELDERLCRDAAAARCLAAAACTAVQRSGGGASTMQLAAQALQLLASSRCVASQPAKVVILARVLLEQVAVEGAEEGEHVSNTAGTWRIVSMLRRPLRRPADVEEGLCDRSSGSDHWRKELLTTMGFSIVGILFIAVKKVTCHTTLSGCEPLLDHPEHPLHPSNVPPGQRMDTNAALNMMYFQHDWGFPRLTFGFMALLLIPHSGLRALLKRHRHALVTILWVLDFLLSHLLFQHHFVHARGIANLNDILPVWNTYCALNLTLVAAAWPLPPARLRVLLVVRALFIAFGGAVWPVGAPLDSGGHLTQARTHSALTAALMANSLRAERAWLGRKMK